MEVSAVTQMVVSGVGVALTLEEARELRELVSPPWITKSIACPLYIELGRALRDVKESPGTF